MSESPAPPSAQYVVNPGWKSLVAVIVMAFVIYAYFSDDKPQAPAPPPLPTTTQWLKTAGALNGGYLQGRRDDLLKLVGQPDSIQRSGDDILLYWKCSDGRIQLVANRSFWEMGGLQGQANSY